MSPNRHEKVGDGCGGTVGCECVSLGEEDVDDGFERRRVLVVEEKEDAGVDVFRVA